MPDCNIPLVSIIIPVHNQSAYTDACLKSLADYPPNVPYEIVVVDDGSTDDTSHLLSTVWNRDRRLCKVRNENPLGFAAACNRGAAAARGAILLFLNNDTEVLPGWFPPLLGSLLNHPDVGVVGPKLIFPDRTVQHCGKVWSDLDDSNAHPQHIYYRFPASHPAVNISREYKLLTGACLLVRAAEFNKLGGFDDMYKNGWEDDDLCYKYTSSGKRVFYCSESEVIHHQNKTLNERMIELESQLPSVERLKSLDDNLEMNKATEEDIALARRVQVIYGDMEQELIRFRNKFDCNRKYFFQKWGDRVKRDDYLYCDADNVPLSEALAGEGPGTPASGYQPETRPTSESAAFPLVSIVILTFNRLDVTRDCFVSIQKHTPEAHEIIFVDNGSTDGTIEWLRQLTTTNSRYRLIDNGSNLGFAKGCNQGIEAAQGRYILLLNNDTVVTSGWLSGLLECFSDSNTGIVGPMTNNISGIQKWPWTTYQSLEGLDRFAAEFRQKYRYRRIPSRRVVGFCMLFDRGLVDKIGMLDEQFGSGNFEDDDFCLRAALEGYNNLIAGDIWIHHVGSATFHGNRIDYGKALLANQALFIQKWSSPVVDAVFAKKIVRLKVLEKAEELNQRGETNAAVEILLQDGIRQIPDEAVFYHKLAEIFLEAGMAREALDVLQEAPQDDVRSILLACKSLLALGLPDQSMQQAQLLCTHTGETPELLALFGSIHLAGGASTAAGQAFERALMNNPACADAYAGLAKLAGDADDKILALALLERAVMLEPKNAGIRSEFVRVAASLNEFAQPERLLMESRHFFPNDAALAYACIDILLRQNNSFAAMAIMEQALTSFKIPDGFMDAALAVRRQSGPLKVDPERYRQGVAVSLCMIVKNEEKNLARCLASAKPIVDEMVIVDTGSSDATRKIAEIFGADVHDFPWNGDYSAARNASLAPARGNWILALDADESVAKQDQEPFLRLVRDGAGKQRAYTIVTRNYTSNLDMENWQANHGEYPQEEAGRGWMPSEKVRLFPSRSDVRFENAIHEMVEPALARCGIPDYPANIVVHHYGYMDAERQQLKKEYYYELGKKKLAESGGSPVAICELAIQAGGIGRYDEAIELWHQALNHDPNSYLAWFNLGYSCLQKGLFRDGSEASKKAMMLRVNYREATVNHAICELCLGNGDNALFVIEEAMRYNSDYPTFLLMHGIIHACRGDEAAASRDFKALSEQQIEYKNFIDLVVKKLLEGERAKEAARLVEQGKRL